MITSTYTLICLRNVAFYRRRDSRKRKHGLGKTHLIGSPLGHAQGDSSRKGTENIYLFQIYRGLTHNDVKSLTASDQYNIIHINDQKFQSADLEEY